MEEGKRVRDGGRDKGVRDGGWDGGREPFSLCGLIIVPPIH